MAIGVGDRHRQATRAGPVAVHVQFAERRIAVEHFEGCLFIEMTLETFRRRILDRILAAILGDQAGTSARRLNAIQCNNSSEEHTSEIQSLMRISYAVFCLKN